MGVAIVGSGPGGLMAADVLSSAQVPVTLFEKRKGLGRKLLIAGSSGLNITNSLPLPEFIAHYSGPKGFWERVLTRFTPQDWIRFIEKDLGIPTFEGTSGRYFVENMKASRLLQAWKERLERQGVQFVLGAEVRDFESRASRVALDFGESSKREFSAVCFCLGGGSYEPQETPLRWPSMFARHGIGFSEFKPSNVGFHVAWSDAFLKEAEGLPIKGMTLTSPRGTRQGEIVITRYGMEGTPVYAVGQTGAVALDLKPSLSAEQILAKLEAVKENLSAIRRVKRQLGLDPAALALIFHHGSESILKSGNLKRVAGLIKQFPLEFLEPRPLMESISSSGGVHMDELTESLMLKRAPGVFVAGEMLDWDVPTGGFLIQGSVSSGFCAAQGIMDRASA
jgi:uncharacterized flavoprotein (TIGR03862 family)